MSKSAIIVIDDDAEDLDIIRSAAADVGIDRPIHYFRDGKSVMDFLRTADVPPFMIICDVNMPAVDGFSIRRMVAAEPLFKYHTVPFIFWSQSATETQIQQAYDLPVQGFFVKPDDYNAICRTLKSMVEYWEGSKHPKLVK